MKIKILFFGLVFVFIMSWIALSLDIPYSNDNSQITVLTNPISSEDFEIMPFIVQLFLTYWSLITFQIGGMPYAISIIFLIINIMIMWVLVSDLVFPLLQSNPWVLLGLVILAAVIALIPLFVEAFKQLIDYLENINFDTLWRDFIRMFGRD